MTHLCLKGGTLGAALALLCPNLAAQPAPYATIPVDESPSTTQPSPNQSGAARGTEVALQTMVVTGTRTEKTLDESPVVVQVIGQERIRRSGATDVDELLRIEPGVYVVPQAGRGSRIEMQGLSSESVLILINGQRINGRINGAVDLRRLKTTNIRQIEIVKGPSSALYGSDALGGVINIITNGALQPGELVARAQSFSRDISIRQGHEWEKLRLEATVGAVEQDSYNIDGSRAQSDGLDSEAGFGQLQGRWFSGERSHVDINLEYDIEDQARDLSGTAGRQLQTRKRIEDWRIGLSPQWSFDAGDLKTNLRFSRYDDQFVQTQQGNPDATLDERTIDDLFVAGAQYDWQLSARTFTVGAEYQFESLEADRLNIPGERDRQAVYLQDDWAARPGLTLVSGLRYDRDSQFGDALAPKLALRWDPTAKHTLRASYGEGFRAPDFKQLLLRFDNTSVGYRVDGNPNLQPERSRSFQLAWTWMPHYAWTFSLQPYATLGEDLIEIVTAEPGPPTIFTYQNVQTARIFGADALLAWEPQSATRLELSYSRLRTENRSNGGELSGRAPHRVGVQARHRFGAFEAVLRSQWVDERVFNLELDSGGPPTAAGTAPDYTLLDLRLEWQPKSMLQGWTFAAGGENLLDAGDAQFLPIAPRQFLIELRKELL